MEATASAAKYYFNRKLKKNNSTPSPGPESCSEALDSSNEVFGQTPDSSVLGATDSPVRKDTRRKVESFRSPQVILDSDSSSSLDDPKDLHRDIVEDDSDEDVPLVQLGTKSQRALISSDSEEEDEEDVPGRFDTFSLQPETGNQISSV